MQIKELTTKFHELVIWLWCHIHSFHSLQTSLCKCWLTGLPRAVMCIQHCLAEVEASKRHDKAQPDLEVALRQVGLRSSPQQFTFTG